MAAIKKGDECNGICPKCKRRLVVVTKNHATCWKGCIKLTSVFSKFEVSIKK